MIKNIQGRLCETGFVKIGRKVPSKDGKSLVPSKLEHFLVCTKALDKDRNHVIDEEYHKAIGPKPTKIKIVFLFDAMEANFYTDYSWYAKNKRVCMGDGETALRLDLATGKYNKRACVCDELGKLNGCKPKGKLRFVLADRPIIGGTHSFKTTSWNSIPHLIGSFEHFAALGIPLAGIPVDLVVSPASVMHDGKNVKIHVVHFELGMTVDAAHELVMKRAQRMKLLGVRAIDEAKMFEESAARTLAQEAADETDEEAADHAAEFAPDATDAGSPSPAAVKNQLVQIEDGPPDREPGDEGPDEYEMWSDT